MTALKITNGTFVVVARGHEAKTFRVENLSLTHQGDWIPSDLADDGVTAMLKAMPHMLEAVFPLRTISRHLGVWQELGKPVPFPISSRMTMRRLTCRI